MRDSEVDMKQQHRPCNPKQQLYEGEPGAALVCPVCHQTMRGIRYDYGIGLLTLPTHYNPLSGKRSPLMFSPERVFRRRSVGS